MSFTVGPVQRLRCVDCGGASEAGQRWTYARSRHRHAMCPEERKPMSESKIQWNTAPLRDDPAETDVSYLGFTPPVCRALARAGIVTVRDLQGTPWRRLMRVRGVGVSTVRAVYEEFWRAGLCPFDEDEALRDPASSWLYLNVDFETRGDTAADAGLPVLEDEWV